MNRRTARRIKLRLSDKKYNPTQENATAVTPVKKSTTPIKNDGRTCSADGRQSGSYQDECHANQAERGNDVEMRGADGRKEDAANASLVDGRKKRRQSG